MTYLSVRSFRGVGIERGEQKEDNEVGGKDYEEGGVNEIFKKDLTFLAGPPVTSSSALQVLIFWSFLRTYLQ